MKTCRARTPGRPSSKASELISQSELHDSRLRQQARVIAKGAGYLLQRGDAGASLCAQSGECVEADLVENVEHLPAELQALALPRHLPTLGECHIDAHIAIAANQVAGSALPGEGMSKIGKSRGTGW